MRAIEITCSWNNTVDYEDGAYLGDANHLLWRKMIQLAYNEISSAEDEIEVFYNPEEYKIKIHYADDEYKYFRIVEKEDVEKEYEVEVEIEDMVRKLITYKITAKSQSEAMNIAEQKILKLYEEGKLDSVAEIISSDHSAYQVCCNANHSMWKNFE